MFFPPLLTGFLSLFGSPNRIDGDTKSKREGLNDRLCRIGHADSERELAQLIEKECSDRRGDGESATASQRSAAENHNGDRREQERVALKGRWLAGDSGEQKARDAVKQLGIDVGHHLMKPHVKPNGPRRERIGA